VPEKGVSKSQVQLLIAILMFGLWGIGIIVAAFDGDVMVRVMTPLMTMMIGWLFTDKASSSDG